MTTAPTPANAGGLPAPIDALAYLSIPEEPDMEPGFSRLARLRLRLEEEIERLIGVLDAINGDPDFEQSACDSHGRGFPTDPSPDDAEVA